MNSYHQSTLDIYKSKIKKMKQLGNEQAVEVLTERLEILKKERQATYDNAAKLRKIFSPATLGEGSDWVPRDKILK